MQTIRIGTRSSQLALWQANKVANHLQQGGFKTELVLIETKGDKILDVSIAKIGSKGVFTEEIEEMLAKGEIDIAVHSAKDMPSSLPPGFELICFGERERVSDVLISRKPEASISGPKLRLGTSSTRRLAQLARYYPQHEIVNVRGNLQTRIRKMDEGHCDALLLAFAGVHRMGYGDLVKEFLPDDQFIPPAGQGSVTVEVHSQLDPDLKAKIRLLFNHDETEACILAERAFLKSLGGGCSVPVFALATMQNEEIRLKGGVLSLDGQTLLSETRVGSIFEAEHLGISAAESVIEQGGKTILNQIKNQL